MLCSHSSFCASLSLLKTKNFIPSTHHFGIGSQLQTLTMKSSLNCHLTIVFEVDSLHSLKLTLSLSYSLLESCLSFCLLEVEVCQSFINWLKIRVLSFFPPSTVARGKKSSPTHQRKNTRHFHSQDCS